MHVGQRTNGVRSLSIVGRGARGCLCGTAERVGCMGVPAVAECHFRTSLVYPASAGPCPVSAGHRGRGYPGMYKLPL